MVVRMRVLGVVNAMLVLHHAALLHDHDRPIPVACRFLDGTTGYQLHQVIVPMVWSAVDILCTVAVARPVPVVVAGKMPGERQHDVPAQSRERDRKLVGLRTAKRTGKAIRISAGATDFSSPHREDT